MLDNIILRGCVLNRIILRSCMLNSIILRGPVQRGFGEKSGTEGLRPSRASNPRAELRKGGGSSGPGGTQSPWGCQSDVPQGDAV